MSIEAKVLYGLLLDRMGLSVRNGWMDGERRVYIYFTQEDAMTLMNCGKDKATKLFRELDQDCIGLIERKKQGQGRPTRIYVKNFTLPPESGQTPSDLEPAPPQEPHGTVQTAENQRLRPLDSAALLTAENRSLHRWKRAVKTAVFPSLIRLIRIKLISTTLNHPYYSLTNESPLIFGTVN